MGVLISLHCYNKYQDKECKEEIVYLFTYLLFLKDSIHHIGEGMAAEGIYFIQHRKERWGRDDAISPHSSPLPVIHFSLILLIKT